MSDCYGLVQGKNKYGISNMDYFIGSKFTTHKGSSEYNCFGWLEILLFAFYYDDMEFNDNDVYCLVTKKGVNVIWKLSSVSNVLNVSTL